MSLSLIYFIQLFYLESCFFYYANLTNISFVSAFLYCGFIAFLFSFITKLFPQRQQAFILKIFSAFLAIYFAIEIIFYKAFAVFFSFSSFGMIDQLKSFSKNTIQTIFNNSITILIIFIPFIIFSIFSKKINYQQINFKYLIKCLISLLILYSLFYLSLNPNNKILYFEASNIPLIHKQLGTTISFTTQVRKLFIKQNQSLTPIISQDSEIAPSYEKQISSIDFNKLAETSDDSNIAELHDYVANLDSSFKNEYTGYFKDKNLILLMAESFNGIAVSAELTPTLYKLVHSGFHFENFYSPVILSTIGGEFQELTGLYPDLSMLSYRWRTGVNEFPFGIAKVFEDMNYQTYAYHNHDFDFQERNIYLESLGFDNYQGCFNGLEKKINCEIFPKSDLEMIDATINDYINDDKFMVYYATVSGHMNYDFTDNAMSIKNQDLVKDLPYSNRVKAYLATQIELDKALESLLNKLAENNKLDDTVIALVGDHYPYALSLDEVNEIAPHNKDATFEINRSPFILYNAAIDETINVDKVGGQIDVIPTIYNLFAIPYDSRLFAGRDILDSKTPGLVIFNDASWINDIGKYNASSNEFIPFSNNEKLNDQVIQNINDIVANRINFSAKVMEYNYYHFLSN